MSETTIESARLNFERELTVGQLIDMLQSSVANPDTPVYVSGVGYGINAVSDMNVRRTLDGNHVTKVVLHLKSE